MLLLLSSARAVRAMACSNHCLQSYLFQNDFFGELIASFPAPQYGFTIFLAVILSDLIKLSLSFKIKT